MTIPARYSRRVALQRGLCAAAGISAGYSALQHTPEAVAQALAPAPAADQFAALQTAFAFRLFGQLSAGTPQNTFLSPLSVAIALSMTANGARGATQQAILRTLGAGTMGISALNQASAALLGAIGKRDRKVTVEIADSFWVRQGLGVRPAFAQTLKSVYEAEINSLDFRNPAAAGTINSWVSKKTHGLISEITGPIPPQTVLYLINAIYFHADWATPFSGGTTPQPFTLLGGKRVQVPMMVNNNRYAYYGDQQLQAIGLPYGSGRFSMYVLLPAPGTDARAFFKSLNPGMLGTVLNKLSLAQGTISLPRFTASYSTNLIPALGALGMRPAFAPGADLSGMLTNAQATINAVLHKAVIKVYEAGTTAAAVTAVVGTTAVMAKPFSMTVDRPFFLLIRDDTAGVPLFMGSIVDPR